MEKAVQLSSLYDWLVESHEKGEGPDVTLHKLKVAITTKNVGSPATLVDGFINVEEEEE